MRSRIWIHAVPWSAAFALCGCMTTYVGQKIGADGALSKPGGVPFVMTKPEYTLSIAADATEPTKPVYTLDVGYVPDATQRFTLALDPALLVNGKLDLDFGVHGNLTGAAATTTTRVVETFGALVALGTKLETTKLLDAASTLTAYKTALRANPHAACTAVMRSIEELELEAQREIGDRTNAARARAEWVGERLHYLDQGQRECMEEVVNSIEDTQQKPNETAFKSALEASKAAAGGSAELALLSRQIAAEVAALNEDALAKIADGLVGKPDPLPLAQKAAAAGALFVKTRLAGRFARSLAGMTPDVWRARHLAYLERAIARCRAESVVPGSKSSSCGQGARIDDRLKALRLEWSRTLGEAAVVDRVVVIDDFLVSVPRSSQHDRGRHSQVEEHVKLREERDRLQARIDQMRSDLVGKNRIVSLGADVPKASKVEPRRNVSVTLAKETYVAAVNAAPEKFRGTPLPEFVLVLVPDDSGATSPLPVPDGVKK